jgi:hypothetical protein
VSVLVDELFQDVQPLTEDAGAAFSGPSKDTTLTAVPILITSEAGLDNCP